METQNGPISITALLAASNQTPGGHPEHVQPVPQNLPPLPPKVHQGTPRTVSPSPASYHQALDKPSQQQVYYPQPQPQQQTEYYVQGYQEYHQQQVPRSIIQPHQQPQIVTPVVPQLQNGLHILSHHNPYLNQPQPQSTVIRQQVLPPQNIQRQQPQSQNQSSRIYELIQQQVAYSKPNIPIPPVVLNPIIAKPQTSPKQLSTSRRGPAQSKQYIVQCDDKLLDKIQQMQSQITKLSRAIIKKDNEELQSQLTLNQIIQQKDRILERKNRELETSTRRIKLLIEQSESKDLEIQRLKLEIERANRINNISVDMSKIEDVEIRNDTDVVRSSAYYKDLVQQSIYPIRGEPSSQRKQGVGKEGVSNRVHNIHQGLISPALIDLRYAKPAGETNIYQPSGTRPKNYY